MLEVSLGNIFNSNRIYTGRFIKIVVQSNNFSSISFKFGHFAQQINDVARSEGVDIVEIAIWNSQFLSSFHDLIGINDIDQLKQIHITQHSFSKIDIEEIGNIRHQIKYLAINNKSHDNTKKSQCLDFTFLNAVPNLEKLDLSNNQIECIDNFMVIQKHSNLVALNLSYNKISSLDFNLFQGTNLKYINLRGNRLSRLSLSLRNDDDTSLTSQMHQCLDFNSFNHMKQLQRLYLDDNQIECIINFESIQQHSQLTHLSLSGNHVLTPTIDFSKFDESTPMNSLRVINFRDMNLQYTRQNNHCLDLQFLNFMANVIKLDLSYNKIECIDNLSILQRDDIQSTSLNLNYSNHDHNLLLVGTVKNVDEDEYEYNIRHRPSGPLFSSVFEALV